MKGAVTTMVETKQCVYLTTYMKDMQEFKADDINVAFDKVDIRYNLPHDDVARTMYIVKRCPMNLSWYGKKAVANAMKAGTQFSDEFIELFKQQGITADFAD